MNDEKKEMNFGGMKGKGVFKLVGIVLALFLLVLTIKELKGLPYVGREVPATNVITVSGKGEVFQAPDVATFDFTVEAQNLVVSKAQDTVTKSTNDILSFLKKNGVADKDVKTVGYNIYPRYEYTQSQSTIYPYPQTYGKQTLAAYVVSQSVEVKVRNLSDAGKLVSGVGELGATNLSGLNFTIDKEDDVIAEARDKAIEDAKSKAKVLAKQLGVSLIRIVNFSENGNYPIYYSKAMASDVGMGMGGAVPEAASLPTGENKYTSNVSISYEIR